MQRYVLALEKAGKIERTRLGSISVMPKLKPSGFTLAPLVGSIACGQPVDAVENIEGTFALPKAIFGNGNLFMLRAKGDSMIDAGIKDDDLIVIRKQNTAENVSSAIHTQRNRHNVRQATATSDTAAKPTKAQAIGNAAKGALRLATLPVGVMKDLLQGGAITAGKNFIPRVRNVIAGTTLEKLKGRYISNATKFYAPKEYSIALPQNKAIIFWTNILRVKKTYGTLRRSKPCVLWALKIKTIIKAGIIIVKMKVQARKNVLFTFPKRIFTVRRETVSS